jgi:hypothetical protein
MGENYITVVNPHFQDSTPIKEYIRCIPLLKFSCDSLETVLKRQKNPFSRTGFGIEKQKDLTIFCFFKFTY